MAGVVFGAGEVLGRGNLDVFLTSSSNAPTNAYSITFAIYYVDPGTEAEVLIGSPARTPVNPSVGEYYAAIQVPPNAAPGNYRIRWTFRQYASSPDSQVVQEFGIVGAGAQISSPLYSQSEADMIHRLRILLRDNCVGGEEVVELDVAGERMFVRLDELYEVLYADQTD